MSFQTQNESQTRQQVKRVFSGLDELLQSMKVASLYKNEKSLFEKYDSVISTINILTYYIEKNHGEFEVSDYENIIEDLDQHEERATAIVGEFKKMAA